MASILDRDAATGGYVQRKADPHLMIDLLRQAEDLPWLKPVKDANARIAKENPSFASFSDEASRMLLPGTPTEAALSLVGGPFGKIGTKAGLGLAGASLAGDAESSPMVRALRAGKTAARAGAKEGAAIGEVLERAKPDTSLFTPGYLPNPPKNPNPQVGTRFETEHIGGLVPEVPLDISKKQGASLTFTPWDASTRNDLVTSVSGKKLSKPVMTTGGRKFARDVQNVAEGRGGASNRGIANRVQDRVNVSSREGLDAGGTGEVLMLPSSMGSTGEFFSSMPSNVQIQLLRDAGLNKADRKYLSDLVRTHKIQVPGKGLVQPFGNFAGFDSPDLERQLAEGLGQGATGGMLRTAVADRLSLKDVQQLLDYNAEDMMAAIRDPALRDLDKGFTGSTVIQAQPGASVMDISNHPDYNTGTRGLYQGSFGPDVPVEIIAPKLYEATMQDLLRKGFKPGFTPTENQLRTMTLNAMDKRKAGISELIDQRVIDSHGQYLHDMQRALREGSY